MTAVPNDKNPDQLKLKDVIMRRQPKLNQSCIVAEEIGQRLVRRFEAIRFTPKRILNLGLSDASTPTHLKNQFPQAWICDVDINIDRLQQFGNTPHKIVSHLAHLPFAPQSFDLIFSNLSLHTINQLSVAMTNLFNVLKPGGMLLFSCYGPDTLKEVRMAWQHVDQSPHVHHFWDMHDIGDLMRYLQFEDAVTDSQWLLLDYSDLKTLWSDLAAAGDRNALSHRRQTLTGPQRFKAMETELRHLSYHQQAYRISHEILYGHGFKALTDKGLAKSQNSNEYRIDVHSIPVKTIMNNPVGTVIFDFDSTLVSIESLEIILNKQLKDRSDDMEAIQALTERGMNGEIDFATSLNSRLEIAAPNHKDIEQFAKQSWQYLSFGIEQLIPLLHKHAIDVWVFSGGLTDAIQPLCLNLGIPASQVHGIDLLFDDQGQFSQIDPKCRLVQSKLQGTRPYIGNMTSPIIMIGDGMSDYELYQENLVDHFIAYTANIKREVLLMTGCRQAESINSLKGQLSQLFGLTLTY